MCGLLVWSMWGRASPHESEHGVSLYRGCTKALAIRHHGSSWQAREAWLTSLSRWWIGAAGIRTAFTSCCWTPFRMPTTAQTSVTGSSWWDRCTQHGGCHIRRYADHRARTLPEKWGTLGEIVREASVGFSSLSSTFVCDDLIKDMREEGEMPVMQHTFSNWQWRHDCVRKARLHISWLM